jgi:hypothetical protein
MCLDLYKKYLDKKGKLVLKTATEDIVCYKMYCVRKMNENDDYLEDATITSPYQNTLITYSQKSGLSLVEALGIKEPRYYEVGRGFIHTFASKESAMRVAEAQQVLWYRDGKWYAEGKEAIVSKCVIPKGTQYVEGLTFIFGKDRRSYGSDAIRIVDLVNYSAKGI